MSMIPSTPAITVKAVLAVAALAVALAEPGGCAPAAPSGGNGGAGPADPTPKACDTHPQAPHVITFQGKRSVEAVALSTCEDNHKPLEHHVQVFLEKQVANRWVGQNDPAGKPAANCLNIPGAGDPEKCRWIITRCENGLWRTRVVVFGHGPSFKGYPQGKPFNLEIPEKPEARLTC